MKTKLVILILVLAGITTVIYDPAPDYTTYARTGEHPRPPKYELEGEDYYPAFADRLGTTIHWLECERGGNETRVQCVRRTGCSTDSDCIEWENWLVRHD